MYLYTYKDIPTHINPYTAWCLNHGYMPRWPYTAHSYIRQVVMPLEQLIKYEYLRGIVFYLYI